MSMLALIATGKRNIKSGLEYDRLFPPAKMKDDIILRNGNVKDTVHLMAEVVHKYLDDTTLLAAKMQGHTLEDTCRKLWNFIYTYIQYKLDQKGVEQLRRPARTWHDRTEGVDCDCYSIFISSVLTNLGIPHKFRITKYEGDWQHVYVIVPSADGSNYILDCVVDAFNYEKPYSDKFEYNMTTLNGLPIAVLSGVDDTSDNELFGITSGVDFEEIDYLNGTGAVPSAEKELQAIYNHLVRTRDYILQNPQSVITSGGAKSHLEMLNYAIQNWNTPNRDKALDILEQEEERWNQHNGVSGVSDTEEEEINGLGAFKGLKKFWSKVKEITKKVGQGIKKIGKAIIRYNPLSIAIRGGFLLAMKINILHIASKLYPAYLSEAEAKTNGISSEQWQKTKRALEKVEKLFVDTLQGKANNLKNAIMNGRARKQFHGFGELGEPATITAVISAVAPLIAADKALSKEGLSENKNGDSSKSGFIQKIRDWWKRNFSKENSTAQETVSDAEKAPNEKTTESTEPVADQENNNNQESPSNDGKPESTWSKISSFVKENPTKTIIGTLVAGTVITLAVSHKARHAVGLGAIPKRSRSKNKNHSKRKQLQYNIPLN